MVTLGLKLAPGQPNNFCTNSERRAGAYRALLGWLRAHKAARVRFVPHGVAFAHVAARSSGAPPLSPGNGAVREPHVTHSPLNGTTKSAWIHVITPCVPGPPVELSWTSRQVTIRRHQNIEVSISYTCLVGSTRDA